MTNSRRRLIQAGIAAAVLAAFYLLRAGADRSAPRAPDGPAGSGTPPPATGSAATQPSDTTTASIPPAAPPSSAPSGGPVSAAFRARRSNVEVETGGRVTRVLPDDRQGSRHERFVVKVDGGTGVLVAHNLDLAPRVPVTVGDSVEVRGEYEWNSQGGVIHWTHRDPDGRHEAGWIRLRGRLYQ
jgi:hypothetical protein